MESEGLEHPARNELAVGFLDILVRPIRQVDPFGIGNRDRLCLAPNRRPHVPEHRVRAAVVSHTLTVSTGSLKSHRVEPLWRTDRQRSQQQGIDQPES